jgi:hypothetical protein
MRACDHQAMLPMFMGVTKKVAGYDFLIADGYRHDSRRGGHAEL